MIRRLCAAEERIATEKYTHELRNTLMSLTSSVEHRELRRMLTTLIHDRLDKPDVMGSINTFAYLCLLPFVEVYARLLNELEDVVQGLDAEVRDLWIIKQRDKLITDFDKLLGRLKQVRQQETADQLGEVAYLCTQCMHASQNRGTSPST